MDEDHASFPSVAEDFENDEFGDFVDFEQPESIVQQNSAVFPPSNVLNSPNLKHVSKENDFELTKKIIAQNPSSPLSQPSDMPASTDQHEFDEFDEFGEFGGFEEFHDQSVVEKDTFLLSQPSDIPIKQNNFEVDQNQSISFSVQKSHGLWEKDEFHSQNISLQEPFKQKGFEEIRPDSRLNTASEPQNLPEDDFDEYGNFADFETSSCPMEEFSQDPNVHLSRKTIEKNILNHIKLAIPSQFNSDAPGEYETTLQGPSLNLAAFAKRDKVWRSLLSNYRNQQSKSLAENSAAPFIHTLDLLSTPTDPSSTEVLDSIGSFNWDTSQSMEALRSSLGLELKKPSASSHESAPPVYASSLGLLAPSILQEVCLTPIDEPQQLEAFEEFSSVKDPPFMQPPNSSFPAIDQAPLSSDDGKQTPPNLFPSKLHLGAFQKFASPRLFDLSYMLQVHLIEPPRIHLE
eukprot:Sdes_comp20922_c0_seq1m18331